MHGAAFVIERGFQDKTFFLNTYNKVGQCGIREMIGKHLQLLCCGMEACDLRKKDSKFSCEFSKTISCSK